MIDGVENVGTCLWHVDSYSRHRCFIRDVGPHGAFYAALQSV